MLKGLFAKKEQAAPAEGIHKASAEERLLRIFIQEYCYHRHICLKDLMQRMEREIIYLVLEDAHGNQHAAAALLGVRPNTLHYKIHRLGLVPVHHYMMAEDVAAPGQPDRPGMPPPNRRSH